LPLEIGALLFFGENMLKMLTPDLADKIENALLDGLEADGAHHKQYYLEDIAKMLKVNLSDIKFQKGIAP
jgi:hypothetical protein